MVPRLKAIALVRDPVTVASRDYFLRIARGWQGGRPDVRASAVLPAWLRGVNAHITEMVTRLNVTLVT